MKRNARRKPVRRCAGALPLAREIQTPARPFPRMRTSGAARDGLQLPMRSCAILSGEVVEDRAVGAVVAVAAVDEAGQRGAHALELGDLAVDLPEVRLGHLLHVAAGAGLVLVEREQRPALLDREAERAGAAEERQLVHVGGREGAVAVAAAARADQADVLVVADGLRRQAAPLGDVSDVHGPIPPRRMYSSSAGGSSGERALDLPVAGSRIWGVGAEFGRLTWTRPTSLQETTVVRDPVCGMTVDPSAGKPRHVHAGHTYHFCSEGCRARFAAAPEDYVEATDPVCGMKVDRSTARHMAEHAGERFYFCSGRCKEKFEAAPEAYLADRPAPEPMPAGTIYTCPMHPEIEQVGPGDCPICGMALEPKGVPTGEEGPNPELVDFRRRFAVGAALTVPLP